MKIKTGSSRKVSLPAVTLYVSIFLALVLLVAGVVYWKNCQKKTLPKSQNIAVKSRQLITKKTSEAVASALVIEPRNDYEKQMVSAAKQYWTESHPGDTAEVVLKNLVATLPQRL